MSDQDTEAGQHNVDGPEAVYINPGPAISAALKHWSMRETDLASVNLEIKRFNSRGSTAESLKLGFTLSTIVTDMEFDVCEAAGCLHSEQNMRERLETWLQMPGNFRDQVQRVLKMVYDIDVSAINAAAWHREEEVNRSAVYRPGSNNPSNN